MRDFRSLALWKKAHGVVLRLYAVSGNFPKAEQFGLVSQLRRAALSMPTNIVEGCGRSAEGDFRRFLEIAAGSARETEYLVLLAGDLEYLDADTARSLMADIHEVKRMLSALTTRLRQAASLSS